MGASDSNPPPASASLGEEPSEAAEGRSTRQEPLDLSQVRDAACGPIYFEGKRPVTLFRLFAFDGVVGWGFSLI